MACFLQVMLLYSDQILSLKILWQAYCSQYVEKDLLFIFVRFAGWF